MALLNRWKLDNNGTDTQGNNNATPSNMTYSTSEKIGDGYSGIFNGSNGYLTAANSANWDLGTGDFAISMWVKTTQSGTFSLLTRDNGSGNRLRLQTTGAKMYLSLIAVTEQYGFSDTVFNTGKWMHLIAARQGENIDIYYNGKITGMSGESSGRLSDIDCSADLWIGRPYSGGNYYNGKMDDVRFYTNFISAADALNLYQSYYADSKFFGGSNL